MKRPTFHAINATLALVLLGGCASRQSATTTTTPAPSRSSSSARPVTGGENSVPDIAQREVIRRQEMIRQMDEAAIRASQRMAEDDLEGAVEGYRRAIGQ